jgi:hypothetical protein
MKPPQHLTVQGPEDILGFIPHSLGYWPADSLVAMTLQGKRLGATLRLDLPGPGALADPRNYARTVRDYLRADQNADAALLAFFTNDGWMDPPQTYGGLLAALQAVLGTAGMPVRDAWYVGDTYWRDAYCSDLSCCPLPGRPVEAIRDSRLNAEMVFRGSSVGPVPDRRPALTGAVSEADRAAILAAEASWAARLELRRGSREQFDALLDFWERLLCSVPGAAPSVDVQAFCRASLRVPAWRDAVLVMAAAGRRAAQAGAEQFGIFDPGCGLAAVCPAGLAGLEEAAGVAEVAGLAIAGVGPAPGATPPAPEPAVPGYGDVLLGLEPAVPDWSRMNSLECTLEQLSSFGGQAGAAAHTGRGWIAWCRGRGSYAAAYLGQALEEEGGYRLAELLLELVQRGTLCGWAARKEAAWQKFEPDVA